MDQENNDLLQKLAERADRVEDQDSVDAIARAKEIIEESAKETKWTTDQVREAMAILMDCHPRIDKDFDDGYEIVCDGSVWIGDWVVDLCNPRAVIFASPFEGWWMQGVDHAPGKDYRAARDEEVSHFLKVGIRFRMKTLPSGKVEKVSK